MTTVDRETYAWLQVHGDREPSVDGTWFVVPVATLLAKGIGYVEVHFDDDAEVPNAIRLTPKEETLPMCPSCEIRHGLPIHYDAG